MQAGVKKSKKAIVGQRTSANVSLAVRKIPSVSQIASMLHNEKKITQVCLMDSDPICTLLNQKLIGAIDAGMAVVPVNNAEQAIDYFRCLQSYQNTLVLLDVCMPQMSGFELLDALQQQQLMLPHIAVLTASIHEYDQKKVTEYPFLLTYIVKPLTVEKYFNFLKLVQAA